MRRVMMCLIFLIASLLQSPSSIASLGGSEATIEGDRDALAGSATLIRHTGYSVHQITATNVTLNEYAAPGGIVFAVSWRGMRPPDLSAVLGTYFGEYQAAAKSRGRTRRRGAFRAEAEHIVIEMGGHMRHIWGRVFVPALLPSGVSEEVIR